MSGGTELVSELRATLTHGLGLKSARKVLRSLEDEFLMPAGLYLIGGLSEFADGSNFSPEIAGLVTRADGSNMSERDRTKVEAWLAANPQVTEFSMGMLKPANSPDLLPIDSEEGK